MNVLFVMCGGPHDAQFVGRLLRESARYSAYDARLSQWPRGIGAFVIGKFREQDVDGIRINKSQYPLVPMCALLSADKAMLVLPISLGGMDQHEKGKELLRDIEEDFADPAVKAVPGNSDVANVAVLFLYDADDRGVNETVRLFKESVRYGAHFDNLDDLEHGKWCFPKGYPLSVFVFAKDDGAQGTLEDYLEQCFGTSHKALYESAAGVSHQHFPAKDEAANALAHETKKKKAILTTCGQQDRDNAGASLAVIIRDTALLSVPLRNDQRNSVCGRLLALIESAFVTASAEGTT